MKIVIRGDSVAAWCCAHLLKKAGLRLVVEQSGRSRVPAIMLSENAVSLIRDVFEQPNLFARAPRIVRRIVKWGRNAAPVALEHAAIVVSEQEILAELRNDGDLAEPDGAPADFTVFATRPLPQGPAEHSFGGRVATAVKVRLKDTADAASCWIESLEEGWLFLIPNGPDSAWLLAVGCPPEMVLERSGVIAGRLASIGEPAGRFPADPRIMAPLTGSNWLACGTAGLAFDPICGDGTAHAVREAILASAVIQGISTGGDAAALLTHYEARLTLGFYRHLAASVDFYRSGDSGPWWDGELESLRRGLGWCEDRMKAYGRFRYQLIGFELKAVA